MPLRYEYDLLTFAHHESENRQQQERQDHFLQDRQIFFLYLLVSLAWQTLHNFHWSNKFLCYFSSVYLILCFCNPIFSLLFEVKNIQAFLSLTFSLQQWQHLLQSEFLVLRFFYSFGYQPFYYDLKIVCIKKVVLFFRYIW